MDLFLVFLKDKEIVPIRLEDADLGAITNSLIKQGFLISPIQIKAGDSGEATEKFRKASLLYMTVPLSELVNPIVF